MSDMTIGAVTDQPIIIEVAAQGPVGPPGLPGAAGSYATMILDGSIPVGQLFTFFNGAGALNITLPSIASVIQGAATAMYALRNLGPNPVTINAFAGDNIEGSPTIQLLNAQSSWTLVATSTGWYVI